MCVECKLGRCVCSKWWVHGVNHKGIKRIERKEKYDRITKEKRKGGGRGDAAKKVLRRGGVVVVVAGRRCQCYRGWATRHVTPTQEIDTLQKDKRHAQPASSLSSSATVGCGETTWKRENDHPLLSYVSGIF